jgi:hypothetical protein
MNAVMAHMNSNRTSKAKTSMNSSKVIDITKSSKTREKKRGSFKNEKLSQSKPKLALTQNTKFKFNSRNSIDYTDCSNKRALFPLKNRKKGKFKDSQFCSESSNDSNPYYTNMVSILIKILLDTEKAYHYKVDPSKFEILQKTNFG